jgi:hypothetical protein
MNRPLVALLLLVCGEQLALAQWGPETAVTSTGSDIFGEGIAASGSTLHMIYGSGSIRHRKSTDEGATWGAESVIGTGTLHLTDPIVADGNDVWVVYLSNIQNFNDWCCSRDAGNIWLLHSGNGGTSWDAPVQLTAPRTAYRLSLAYAADRLHLVWMDYRAGAWDTYYLRSPDRGASWDPEVVIAPSSGQPFGAERPQVAARGDSVHVTIWDDAASNGPCTPGNFTFPRCPDTFHVRSLNGGLTWGTVANVANGGTYFAGRNDIAVAGSSSVIINYNVDVPGETGSKLFAIASQDNGATWGTPIRLTFSPNASDHGSIIGSGTSAYLAWHDDRDPTNREIYYRHTPNGGVSWDLEEQVSSGAAGDSSTPLNAVTPGYAHVMWLDNRSGSYQIHYRRRDLSAAPITDAGVLDAGTISSGPLAWWRLDEMSGTSAADSSGNGHTGSVVNGPAWTAGRVAGGLDLGGTQGHVRVASFSPPASLTLQAWINAQANASMDSIILNCNNTTYDFRILGTGFLEGIAGGVSLADTTVNFYSAGNAGTWHHVAYTFDSSNQEAALYIDGSVVATGTNTSGIAPTNNDLWIGRHSQFDFGTFQGVLDDVKIWPRALTSSEVFAEFVGTPASSSSSGGAATSIGNSSGAGTSAASLLASSSASLGASSASAGRSGDTSGSSSSAARPSSSATGSSSSQGATSGGSRPSSGPSSGGAGSSGSTSPSSTSSSSDPGTGTSDGCGCQAAASHPGSAPLALGLLWTLRRVFRRAGKGEPCSD